MADPDETQKKPPKNKAKKPTTTKNGYVKTGLFSNWHRNDNHILLKKILNYPGWDGGGEKNFILFNFYIKREEKACGLKNGTFPGT